MRVLERPPIQFRCTYCKALNEGEEDEFTPDYRTQPPTWSATCGYCNGVNKVYPAALIAKHVGHGDLVQMLAEHPVFRRLTR